MSEPANLSECVAVCECVCVCQCVSVCVSVCEREREGERVFWVGRQMGSGCQPVMADIIPCIPGQ